MTQPPPYGENAGQRKKSRSLKPLSRLMPYVWRYRIQVVGALAALLTAAAATLAVPVAARRMIDHGFSAEDAGLVDSYFAMMLVVVALLALASALRFYLVTWIGERVVADLRNAVFGHLLKLSPQFYETTMTGEVLSRLTADTTQIKSTFGSTISVALRNLVTLAGAVIMMVITSAKLSGITLLALPLVVIPLVGFGRRVRVLSRHAQDTLAGSAALAQESLAGIGAVQAYNQERRLSETFSNATESAFTAARRRIKARAILTAMVIFLASGAIVAVIWHGATEVLSGRMTGGVLGQFVLYAAFAAGAMGALSEVWSEIQLAAGAAERLSELLDARPAIAAPSKPRGFPADARGSVIFEKVSFDYPARHGQRAVESLSFSGSPGETVAIVGPSGAGKSTIFNLIMRFYDATSGAVYVDDVNVKEADPQTLRARIGLVAQDTMIFSGSIADNIRFGAPGADDKAMLAASRAARVDVFADKLPDGYHTQLGEKGLTLSGGQRQRIAIARAILRNAPILLLDEATSALDAESEQHVQAALSGLMQGRTTLVIAHRLSTVREAHRILVMESGRLVAQGRHDELVSQGGLYARLARLQFSDA